MIAVVACSLCPSNVTASLLFDCRSELPLRECAAGAGLQILLEAHGISLAAKLHGNDQRPGTARARYPLPVLAAATLVVHVPRRRVLGDDGTKKTSSSTDHSSKSGCANQ